MEPPAMPEEVEEEEEETPLTAASGPVGCQLFGYVGIEAVLDQMKIKTMKMGFEFNVMVVGEHRPRGLVPVWGGNPGSDAAGPGEMALLWDSKGFKQQKN